MVCQYTPAPLYTRSREAPPTPLFRLLPVSYWTAGHGAGRRRKAGGGSGSEAGRDDRKTQGCRGPGALSMCYVFCLSVLSVLTVCLVCLPVCLYVCMFVCLFVCLFPFFVGASTATPSISGVFPSPHTAYGTAPFVTIVENFVHTRFDKKPSQFVCVCCCCCCRSSNSFGRPSLVHSPTSPLPTLLPFPAMSKKKNCNTK